MRYSIALATLATVVAASEQLNPILDSRQTDNTEEYIQEVCFPNTTSPVPPVRQSSTSNPPAFPTALPPSPTKPTNNACATAVTSQLARLPELSIRPRNPQ
ncbi:unnamed protein product [Aureobasidium pullulans]|nr:unnamed protein product [Aureobasidium pullulans]